MAFNNREAENIKKGLDMDGKKNNEMKIDVPKNIEVKENRKPYTFTLLPSTREKLTQEAKKRNYTSVSRFLNDLIELL